MTGVTASRAPPGERAPGLRPDDAGQDGLEEQSQHDDQGAADDVEPEVANAREHEQGKNQPLRDDGGQEDGMALDVLEEEGHEEQPQHGPVEERAEDVDRLDEVCLLYTSDAADE